MLQGLLIVVLLITIGINVTFILDTSRRLYEENPTTGKAIYCVKILENILMHSKH